MLLAGNRINAAWPVVAVPVVSRISVPSLDTIVPPVMFVVALEDALENTLSAVVSLTEKDGAVLIVIGCLITA